MRDKAISIAGARGALFAAAPAPVALVGWWYAQDGGSAPLWAELVSVLMSLMFAFAGSVLHRRPGRARLAAGLGLFGLFPLAGPSLVESPPLTLFLIVLAILALAALDRATDPGTTKRGRRLDHARLRALAARGAALAAVVVWVVSTLVDARAHARPLGLGAFGLSLLVAIVAAAWWVIAGWRASPRRALAVLAVLVGGLAAAARLFAVDPTDPVAFGILAVSVGVNFMLLPGHRGEDDRSDSLWEPIVGHPERLLAATFALLCLGGTLLLALPPMSATGEAISLGDAAFTAVSAVCVTGLVVLDTAADFSQLGQGVILLLIQVGGLGIMAFSTLAIEMLGVRVSMRHEGVVARLAGTDDRSRVGATFRRVVIVTLSLEVLGAALLLPSFLGHGEPLPEALWRAIFTAISAFCNAGFALAGDSLVAYAADPAVVHVVALLIIAGGLSPVAVVALPRVFRSASRRRLSPHVRIILATTALLLVGGFVLWLALEWMFTLRGLDLGDRIHNAWFQSVTLRTAGFNTVDLPDAHTVTYLVMLAFMFVGGSPGGTAGGARTTTIAVLVLAAVAAVRGRDVVRVFGHRVPHSTIYRAAAVAAVMLAAVFAASAALLLTQNLPARDLVFEAVSALGTVGLSLGATTELDGVGRGIIMACMFLGRVGALTLLMFVGRRDAGPDPWRYPEGRIDVV